MLIKRYLDIETVLKQKSCFLFGPRQTGKSSLIHNQIGNYKFYNLLDTQTYLNLAQNPKRLEEEILPTDQIIIIDEIQKLPALLDEVHLIIEKYGIHFLLTGSSARKLRQGSVNLLGGRARSRTFHPFIYKEISDTFNLEKVLDTGLIPSIYFSDAPYEDLHAYTGDYLKEEIASEALVRNVPAFSRFLEVAALCNSQIINYAKISSDAQVPTSTVQEYFQILKDTLIAFEIPAWEKSQKRKASGTSKFYFFDIGVVRSIQKRRGISLKTVESGEAFETYIAHELQSYCDYHPIKELHHWRSKTGYEVDFILNNKVAIEVKASKNISKNDLKGLKALQDENQLEVFCIISLEDTYRKVDNIHIYPFKLFLETLYEHKFD